MPVNRHYELITNLQITRGVGEGEGTTTENTTEKGKLVLFIHDSYKQLHESESQTM